jgi:hypothetical protein
MNIRRRIGAGMIVGLFVGIFCAAAADLGIVNAVILFLSMAVMVAFILVAVALICSD